MFTHLNHDKKQFGDSRPIFGRNSADWLFARKSWFRGCPESYPIDSHIGWATSITFRWLGVGILRAYSFPRQSADFGRKSAERARNAHCGYCEWWIGIRKLSDQCRIACRNKILDQQTHIAHKELKMSLAEISADFAQSRRLLAQ